MSELKLPEFPWDKMEEIAADDFCDPDCEVQKGCPACIAIKGTRWALQMRAALRESAADKQRIAELEKERDYFCNKAEANERNGLRMRDEGNAGITHWKSRAERAESELAIARDLIERHKR